ncbi:MAG: HD domain-containing phosphohydrolase [Thermotogota bacterium]
MLDSKFSIRTIFFISFILILSIFVFIILFFNNIFHNKQMETQRELILKNAVMHAYTVIEMKHEGYKNRGLDFKEAKEQVKNILSGEKMDDGSRTMESNFYLGDNGYFIIYSLQGDEIMHPRLEGQNVYDVTDPLDDSRYLVREQIEMALEKGSGFYTYNWQYPNDPNKIGEKISYIKYFEPWEWVVVATTYEKDLSVYFDESRNSFIITGIILTILMIPLLFYISKKITKPLSNLNDKMKYFANNMEIVNKNNETRIKEISEIDNSFSDLSEELTAYIQELQGLNEEIESLNSENSMIIEKMNLLLDETSEILDEENEEDFLKNAFDNLYSLIPESSSGVLGLIKGNDVEYICSRNIDKTKLNSIKLNINNYITYKNVFKSKNIKTIHHDKLSKRDNQTLSELVGSVNESLYIPLLGYKKQIGNLVLHSRGDSEFSNESFRIAVYYSKLISLFLTIKNMNEFESNIQKQIIVALIKMMEHHDTYTRGHSQNVANLAEDFSKFLGHNSEFNNKIYWAGMVHDVGKIIIPQDVLNKPSKLTHDEYDLIKKHPVYAFEVLNEIDNLRDISHIVKHHHERIDGKGYPDNLKDGQIPLESKILCLVDTWDAMTRDRSYRKALDKELALNELIKNKDKQFDKELVEKFIEYLNNS